MTMYRIEKSNETSKANKNEYISLYGLLIF